MKLKITRTTVLWGMVGVLCGMIFLACWLFNTHIIFDKIDSDGDIHFGWLHLALNTVMILSFIIWISLFLWDVMEEDESPLSKLYDDDDDYRRRYKNNDEEETKSKPFRWKRWIWIAVLIIVLFQIFKLGKTIYNQSIFVYNTSKKYHNTYQQKVEEKLGYYDKLWKIYLQKEKIASVNKETFIEITKVIMNNVADGKNLSWKWVSRYPDIDYNQFTAFYADLSDFIAKQREGYFNIEKACQTIANQNNTLLDTFPNNIYNRFLKQERIKFEYGFLSDSTNNVFKTKVENLK